jgi:hypothetical protein
LDCAQLAWDLSTQSSLVFCGDGGSVELPRVRRGMDGGSMAAVGRPAAILGTGRQLSQACRPALLLRHLATSRPSPVLCAPGRASLTCADALEHIPFLRNRDVLRIHALAHVLVGEPVSTPDQVRGRLSPEHALAIVSATAVDRDDGAALKSFDDAAPAPAFPSTADEISGARLSDDVRSGRDRVPANGQANRNSRTQSVAAQPTPQQTSSRQRKSSPARRRVA